MLQWARALVVSACMICATESAVRETAASDESVISPFASVLLTTTQASTLHNDFEEANIPFIRVKETENQEQNFANSTTVPNFQSFEEWKKNKLNQNRADLTNSSESGYSIEKPSVQLNTSNNSKKNISQLDIEDVKVNKNIKHIQRDEIHQRIKTRDGDLQKENQNSNNVNAQLGEEMVIEISMFAGSGEEQGKLYKDRFNYASFDCAATIVKTNKEAKGANSILLDNKDSYLLNECSASSNFIIVELCEDILVDEVLVGNFEFYSSMFKDIKISVSDRFPTTQWIVLGEFQAENVRQLQTFGIENPLIWAKFIKIEFLTHYGNEFYCPISSVQVHGTTMIEQFKEDNPDNEEKPDSELISTTEEINAKANSLDSYQEMLSNDQPNETHANTENGVSNLGPEFDVYLAKEKFKACLDFQLLEPEVNCTSKYLKLDQFLIDYEKTRHENFDQCLVDQEMEGATSEEQSRVVETQPHTPSPKVQPQDSIYKNIVKRLSLLESNTTLSLLYIEEQSRLLSDAFTNLESQQAVKFQNILFQLNSTIQSQMDIFQKLNVDVYTSFSRLFEYQQQNFESKNVEISKQISQISSMISFYRNLTYCCLLTIILLFFYILLTKDLYIDDTYFPETSVPTSPMFSPENSPSISPAASIYNIRDLVSTTTAKTLSEQLNGDGGLDIQDSVSRSDHSRKPSASLSTTGSIESVPAIDANSGQVSVPKKANTSMTLPVLYRRRSTLLNSFSKSWSLSPKKSDISGPFKRNTGSNTQSQAQNNSLVSEVRKTTLGLDGKCSSMKEPSQLAVPKYRVDKPFGNVVHETGKVDLMVKTKRRKRELEGENNAFSVLEEPGEKTDSADFEYVYEEEEEERGVEPIPIEVLETK
ncbi:hypothetical protein PMKS-002990 [Pichia membranifaciens]|uniref:SUN-like protein 1 n=1 Tax=Pichia membranifaciens TaxID=4926 RepID=A0A1Q2YIW1_9ASCO|nr:hypothetical protein PMKS-002990 [Pichia membranifaciens]